MAGYEDMDYRRGRSGRPLGRLKAQLKAEGANICCHCGKGIDLSLPPNHKWAWTIEHVLPLRDYPELALDINNAREAHRTCNSSKGARIEQPPTPDQRVW